jgi:hypothetical protein
MKTLLARRIRGLLRPLVHRIDGRFCGLVAATVRPLLVAELERVVTPALDATRADVSASVARTEDVLAYLRQSAQENTLLLDSLVRELVRLQLRVATLEAMIDGREESEEETAAERLMIG